MSQRPRRHPRRSSAPAPTGLRSRPAVAGRSLWTAVRWVLLLFLLGIGIWSRGRYFGWCIHDDAFISFRYARNLVRGAGLVMNPGERVEGISNFLWTLLSAPVLAFGGDPATAAQVVGAALALGLVAGAFLYSERRLGGGWYALVVPSFLAWNLAFVMESLSGLETMAFAACLFAAYVSFLEERRGGGDERGGGGGGARAGLWAVWCAAATLVRPEGTLVFVLLAAYSGLGVWKGEPRWRLGRAILLYLALVAPLFLWRLAYYGSWLPNTFYAKVGYTAAQLARGWKYTVHTFAFTMTRPLLFVAASMTLLALLRPQRAPGAPAATAGWTRLLGGRSRDEALAVACLLSVAYVVYILLVGGDYEPTTRFYMPVLLLLYLLFQEALRTFVLVVQRRGRAAGVVATVLALAGGAGALWHSEARFLLVLQQRGWPHLRLEHHQQLRAAGEWLRDHTSPRSVVALSSIGALPYYADRPIIDMMGLTDRHIGRLRMPAMGRGAAGHEKGDGAYVLERQPDIILFDKGYLFPRDMPAEAVLKEARGVSEVEIAASPRLGRDYELRRATTPAGVLHYFARRDTSPTAGVHPPR